MTEPVRYTHACELEQEFMALGKPEAAERLACWSKLSNAEVLQIAPMAGEWSQHEQDLYCGGFRRCAQALAANSAQGKA